MHEVILMRDVKRSHQARHHRPGRLRTRYHELPGADYAIHVICWQNDLEARNVRFRYRRPDRTAEQKLHPDSDLLTIASSRCHDGVFVSGRLLFFKTWINQPSVGLDRSLT